MIEPPSRQSGDLLLTGGRASRSSKSLDNTLKKRGGSLAVVGFFVDERAALQNAASIAVRRIGLYNLDAAGA